MNFEKFVKEVDRISEARYALKYTSENGRDCKILSEAFESGETPEEFVEWWADKYNLDTLEDFLSLPVISKKLPNNLR